MITGDSPIFEQRPWGSFTILDEGENYKVKRIEVLPEKRLSYQRHSRRSEHWYVIRGTAKVTLNGVEKLVSAGQFIDIGSRGRSSRRKPVNGRTARLYRGADGRLFWRG